MSSKVVLQQWLIDALQQLGGSGTVMEVCKAVWASHEGDLEQAGDLFFTWQYDIRWAAQKLRDQGILVKLGGDRSGIWTIASV